MSKGLIGAMTSSHLVLFTNRRGSFKGRDFKEWRRELIEQCNSPGIMRVVDSAPAHSNVEEIVEEINIQLLRIAPYSHLLNLFFNYFGVLSKSI